MTDLVKRATPRADELTTAEYRAGLERVGRLCAWLRPGAVCFVGLAGWRAAADRKAVAGVQPETLGDTPVYVMPSTSGLNARTTPPSWPATSAPRPPSPTPAELRSLANLRRSLAPSGGSSTQVRDRAGAGGQAVGVERRRRVAATTSRPPTTRIEPRPTSRPACRPVTGRVPVVSVASSAGSVAGAVEVVVGATVVVVVTSASTCTESEASLAGARSSP